MLLKSDFILKLINEIMLSIPNIGTDKFVQKVQEHHMDRYLKSQQRYYEHCF